jgi:hypothetical protein
MRDAHSYTFLMVFTATTLVQCAQQNGITGPSPNDAAVDTSVVVDAAADKPVTDGAMADVAVVDIATDVSTHDAASDTSTPDAGCGTTWPTCDTMPSSATPTTIASLWTANPSRPEFRWVSGAVVTAISRGGCVAGSACQIFVQEPTTATTVAEAAHHAIKVFISAASASRFVSIRLGDQVNIAAYAWRYNVNGQNELLLQVADSCSLRGCMTRTGLGSIVPVTATLDGIGSVMAYENTIGPVLVRLENVSATTDMTTPLTSTTGGLFVAGMAVDGGRSETVSVSPFFLPDSRFVGFTAAQRIRFTSLVGVFGMFIPTPTSDGGVSPRYLQIYPRALADLSTM